MALNAMWMILAAIWWTSVTTSLPLLNCKLSGTQDSVHRLKRFCDSRINKVGTHRNKVSKKNLSYQAPLCILGSRMGLKEDPACFHVLNPNYDYHHHFDGLGMYAAL
jgi:hypothetical protein